MDEPAAGRTIRVELDEKDEELLSKAQEILGTTTKEATVTAALQEVIALKARRDCIAAEAAALQADPEDQAEVRAVNELMEASRPPID